MIEHLIWCTVTAVFAIVAVLLLRKRSAAIRFNILLIALLRFAIPTPWLTHAGTAFAARVPVPIAADFSEFLRGPSPFPSAIRAANSLVAAQTEAVSRFTPLQIALAIWGVGSLVMLAIFLRRLRVPIRAIRAATTQEREALWHASDHLGLRQRADLRIVASELVPGALGFWRPVVVLPNGLSAQLSPAELQAVLAHELAHIHRRDNLINAVAQGVVAAFWFHPAVAWLAHRMLTERETACDELVLSQGATREHYLSGIAKVCQQAISQSHSYAGITGANLKQRLEHIMSVNSTPSHSSRARIVPVLLAMFAILIPAAGGFLRAQSPVRNGAGVFSMKAPALRSSASDSYQGAARWFYQLRVNTPPTGQTDLNGLVAVVESLMAQNKIDAAIKQMQAAVAKEPTRRDLNVALANIYVRGEKYADAIAIYDELLRLEPNAPDILFRLAETYRRRGQLDKALELFRRASEFATPPDVGALLQAGLILDGTGRRSEAKEVYEQILKVDPNHAIALNNLAYIKADDGEDLDRAVQMAQIASKAMPKSMDATETLGWAYFKNNQPEQAVMSYRDALQIDFDRASLQGHLAMALEKVPSPTPEMKELQVLLKDYPSPNRDSRIHVLLKALK